MLAADCHAIRSSSTVGFRFLNANNRGGVDLNGSNWLRAKSYNQNGFVIETGEGSAGGAVERLTIDGAGKGRAVFVPAEPTSTANAVTFDLAYQNIEHDLTENTTVSFAHATPGAAGVLVFKQPASAKTVTFPADGSGVEYSDDLKAAAAGNTLVLVTNLSRTILDYYVLKNGSTTRVFIYRRATSVIP